MFKNKKIIWIAVGVAAIGLGYWYWNKKKKEKQLATATPGTTTTPAKSSVLVQAAQQVANAKQNVVSAATILKGNI